jgi:hypothetical protein
MRILYSAGNRVGANSQLSRFLQHAGSKHEIKIAAYLKSSDSIPHIDWTLDALHYNKPATANAEMFKLFGHRGVPFVNINNVRILLQEIEQFEPELFIVDGEPTTAHIAKKLGIKLWYYSPLHLLNGLEWEKGQLRYISRLTSLRHMLRSMPEPDAAFIYSPFGDIKFRPYLKNGFEWIQPYHIDVEEGPTVIIKSRSVGITLSNSNIAIINDTNRYSALTKILNSINSKFTINLFSPFTDQYNNLFVENINNKLKYRDKLTNAKWLFTTGETSYVSDAFYNLKDICIAPTLTDSETLLNAILCKIYGIGVDVAQVELSQNFATETIEKSFFKKLKKDYLSVQKNLLLHDKINNLCNI